MSYIIVREDVRQYVRRGPIPALPEGWERDPDDDYTIRPRLHACGAMDRYQPANSCCAKERVRCTLDGKDKRYFDCKACQTKKATQ